MFVFYVNSNDSVIVLDLLFERLTKFLTELVTDWVRLQWGTGNEEDAEYAFDDQRNTALIIDPTIYGNVVTFYALFFFEVNFTIYTNHD